jgi:hypothetical protein
MLHPTSYLLQAAKKRPTFKDLDFGAKLQEGVHLAAADYAALAQRIERDASWLEQHNVMDYSLLLAVHRPGLDRDVSKRHSICQDLLQKPLLLSCAVRESRMLVLRVGTMLRQPRAPWCT